MPVAKRLTSALARARDVLTCGLLLCLVDKRLRRSGMINSSRAYCALLR